MEATSREVEEFTCTQGTHVAATSLCSAPAAMQCDVAHHIPYTDMDGKDHGVLSKCCTETGMAGVNQNELSYGHVVNRNQCLEEIKEIIATKALLYNHRRNTLRLPTTSLQYFPEFRSKERKTEKQEMSDEKKQERLCLHIRMRSHTSGQEFTGKNTEKCRSRFEAKYVFSRQREKGHNSGEFRSLLCSTLMRLLVMVIFLSCSDAASRSMIAQEPTFPGSRAYPHLTLQPPVQSHQSSDTIHFTQVPLQQLHATHFTVAPALKSDTFSSRPVASRQDDIGRSLGDQQSHFLVNDVNIEHEDSATSVNEVHVGSTEKVRQRQQNELQQRLRKEREAAAHKWAPVVWLDPKEIFFPGNVLDFLDNINISSSEGIDIGEYGREAGLPQGPLSEEMHLLAPLDTECCNCPLPAFLHGQRPFRGEGPPVYAHIHTCFSAIARTTAAPTTINMLLRTPPGGEPMKARSLRAQIRYLQHPLPRYRRRRIRGRGRGKRDTVHDAHLEDKHSYEHSNETNYETLTRQEKKLVLTEDQLEEQHIKLPNEGNEGIKRKVQEGMLTNTVKMESGNLNRPSTELKNATQPGITANLTSSEVNTTFGVTSERNTRSHQDDQHFSNSPHTDVNIALETELPPAATQELPKFPQSQPIPKLTRTSQPIIIIGNYSRMSHVYATAVPAVLQASRQKNSTDATNTNSSNPTENRPPSKANRRHALSTTGTPGHHFTITYWLFYPYNHGKEVCTTNMIFIGRVAKPLYKGECLGETVVMGNHVGDWEHLSIYFEDGEPRYLYLSAHHFGVFYTYQPEWDRFKYSSQDVREGVYMSPVYPQYLELEQGRLVVYSARGSHGIWPSQGRHMYNNVMVKLEDETGQGHLWDTRHRVHIIDALEEKRRGTTDTHRKWFDFRGKWGNPSSNCHPGLLGFCEVRDGPLGITMKRLNFPCHIPRHYTFPKP